ncbi:PEP-CTERM sorting domain-containing protein [Ideonella livida]|uniref:PEP-CTERM sorting domain-containing protein n=1 Tax=Ideonella livida TaxID=2707176 RepID=A0A7C9PJU9_9BURK|nr:PEP-CTERM sorting domain-containing protein [Ideonella livida]NDY93733.1 PEP-CTERM sorting domain-containing protein [Ideonella livida]
MATTLFRTVTSLATFVGACLLSPLAHAAVTYTPTQEGDVYNNGESVIVNFDNKPSGSSSGLTGVSKWFTYTGVPTGALTSFASFCLEPAVPGSDGLYSVASYQSGNGVSLSYGTLERLFGAALASDALNIAFNANGGLSATSFTTNQAAALQVALWELLIDGVNTAYNHTGSSTDDFGLYEDELDIATATSGNTLAVYNLAQDILDNFYDTSFQGTSVKVWRASSTGTNSQDQVFVTAVPEPTTYALWLGGLGLLATMTRRRLDKR